MRLLDVMGPVMIGPSSSHTAGAARIGRIARTLLAEPPVRVRVGLHGSFAQTYRGHGTDRAVIGGLLDMPVDDPRLRESLALAAQAGLAFEFKPVHLKNAHPNTLVLEVWGSAGAALTLRAASTGGGSIRVEGIDGLAVNFTGEAHTLIVEHRDVPGVIARVSAALAAAGVNIATMQVARQAAGQAALSVLEVDSIPAQAVMDALRQGKDVHRAIFLERF
jgi:L-serine dehydratase